VSTTFYAALEPWVARRDCCYHHDHPHRRIHGLGIVLGRGPARGVLVLMLEIRSRRDAQGAGARL
jgi:hypothetical protein